MARAFDASTGVGKPVLPRCMGMLRFALEPLPSQYKWPVLTFRESLPGLDLGIDIDRLREQVDKQVAHRVPSAPAPGQYQPEPYQPEQYPGPEQYPEQHSQYITQYQDQQYQAGPPRSVRSAGSVQSARSSTNGAASEGPARPLDDSIPDETSE
eukprot:909031-Rhodomonas_salina.2